MESNRNSFGGSRFHTGLVSLFTMLLFYTKDVKNMMENIGNRRAWKDTRIGFLSLACFVRRCKIRFH